MFGTRIIIADSDTQFRKKLAKMLVNAGYLIVAQEEDGLKAIQAIQTMQPDLVIVDAQLPGKSGLEIAKIIEEGRVAPVLLLTAFDHREIVQQAKESWVFAYLVKPVNEANLFPAIELALANFRKMVELEKKVRHLEETLKTRKAVEQAKGILMQVLNINEHQAFRIIQQQSMKRRQPMREVAETILSHNAAELKKVLQQQ